jgi:WD40 repeat protein
MRIWDLKKGKLVRRLVGHRGGITCVKLTNDGLLLSGSTDRTMRLWDAKKGRQLGFTPEHSDPVNSVEFGGPGGAISASDTIRFWQLPD